ncbi:hypothetical protein K9N68_14040 [Kovacikia minuta CCNUW1]|uniref:hypothetical protein n=1 Tax=Kovacikia minuta TaxID=2931930 RepID=UPI001CCAAB00|nr:hypothetical protein [Kovacikia minuta]UBF28857.1 hypothetical protein K9N68_14040 [Kovacikia minuta CCNUW1]
MTKEGMTKEGKPIFSVRANKLALKLTFLLLPVKRAFLSSTGFVFPKFQHPSALGRRKAVVCAVISYKTVSPVQLMNGISALNRGIITFCAFRVYLGCIEMVAIREAAARRVKCQLPF